jgi:hypothetical protein
LLVISDDDFELIKILDPYAPSISVVDVDFDANVIPVVIAMRINRIKNSCLYITLFHKIEIFNYALHDP